MRPPVVLAALALLFTRAEGPGALEHATRRRVYDAICAEPGLSFSALRERLGASTGVVDHHTRLLVRAGLVSSAKLGRFRVFYAGGPAPSAPPLGATARALLAVVGERGEAGYREIMEALGRSKPAVCHHVRRLVARGEVVVERRPDGRVLVRRAVRSNA